MSTKAYHLQKPMSQRTITTRDVTLYLDVNYCLRIRPKQQEPYVLTPNDVQALYNLLHIFGSEIIAEASKTNGIAGAGRKTDGLDAEVEQVKGWAMSHKE